jgi:hemoglobin/transferrin/lactoferrin receptor protein
MNRIILIAFLMAFSYSLKAQMITIKDRQSDEPLELVTLSSNSPQAFATTNAKGEVDIQKFEGAEEIKINHVGHKMEVIDYNSLSQLEGPLLLTPSKITLDQVVVSATRWKQSQSDIPAKISTISPEDMELQNPQTTADLLGTSGEVFIQKSQQGGGSPMIRGFATNRLLISVDGVRMNNAIFRSGNLQNVISLDHFAIERTEVLFGPGSVIYGSDAIGGVMSFTTLDPELAESSDKPLIKGSGLMRFSSANNEQTGHFDVNVGWEKWAMVTSISHFNYGDLRMGSEGPDDYLSEQYVTRIDSVDRVVDNEDPLVQKPTGYKQTNVMQKVRFKPNEKWDLNYAFHYSETSDFPRYDRLVRREDNGQPESARWFYGPQKWAMNNLSITNSRQSGLYDDVTLRLAMQYFEESRFARDFNDPIQSERTEQVYAYSANLDFNKQLNEKHHLFYGFEAIYNEVHSVGNQRNIITEVVEDGPDRYPESTWASYAGYVNYEFKAFEKLTLQAGGRYNLFMLEADFSDNLPYYPLPFENASLENASATGSIGGVYNPNDKWSVNANLSSGFRAPNVDDFGKIFDSEAGSVVVPNSELNAEYAKNVEVGIAKIFGESVKVDLTGYYTILEDAMVRRDFTINGQDSILYDGELSQVQAIQNAAEATVWGVQAGLEVKLPRGFGISSRFNYQEGEEELNDGSVSPSRHAAPWFGVSRLTYSKNKLKMQIYALYSGEVSFENLNIEERGKPWLYATDANGNLYSPSWYTVNFKANYRLNSNLSLSAGLENILDKRYRPYSSGLTAAGRNVVLSARATF